MENNENMSVVMPEATKGKNNNALIVFLLIVIIGLVGYIVYDKVTEPKETSSEIKETKTVEKTTKEEVTKEEKKENTFGKEVVLSKLSAVEISEGYKEDLSKFNILSEDDEYVTLYMNSVWSKHSPSELSTAYQIIETTLKENNIAMGSEGLVRGLNKEDLVLLGCSMDTKKCENVPSWAANSITGAIDGKYYEFPGTTGSSLTDVAEAGVLVNFHPVIKILKSNIQ